MLWLKLIHVSCVVLSFSGFVFRGILAIRGSSLLNLRLLKILPHAIDSLLLLSALALVYSTQLSVINTPWLIAKLIALPCYIGLGVVALRPATSEKMRYLAWTAALIVFLYIVSVAISKSASGFLTLFI